MEDVWTEVENVVGAAEVKGEEWLLTQYLGAVRREERPNDRRMVRLAVLADQWLSDEKYALLSAEARVAVRYVVGFINSGVESWKVL